MERYGKPYPIILATSISVNIINTQIVRERYEMLKQKYKQQKAAEERGSGIVCDHGELRI